MKLQPRSDKTVCPYSGTVDDDDAFLHPKDRDAGVEIAKAAVLRDVHAAIGDMLDGVARKSGGLIKVSRSRAPLKPKPRFVRRDLMRELVCDHCGRDYGVYAIALFCPDCGAPNLRLHFEREAELVADQVSLAETLPKEQRELAYRLLGNAHEDVLTAFEMTQKTVYAHLAKQASLAPKPVGNDFQNIDRAKVRFAELDFDPFGNLEPEALAALRLNVQKRHVIGHNLGIVDAKFAQHATDARLGETVGLVGNDIRVFAGLCQAVIDALDAQLAGGLEAPTRTSTAAASEEIASASNDSEARVDGLALGPLAVRVARWLTLNLDEGRVGPIKSLMLKNAFADAPQRELDEALAELALDGFISTTRSLGPEFPRISVTLDLYATFDPLTIGNDPTADSGTLATLALDFGDSVQAKDLHQQCGWTKRRFNPALGILAEQIDERRVRKSPDDAYNVHGFLMTAEDRVVLRRYSEAFTQ